MSDTPEGKKGDQQTTSQGMTGHQTYNVISDTVAGANVRLKDNVIQAIAILVFILLGAGIGALVVEERIAGALVGAIAGLVVVGFFASGIFLMIYRFVAHLRGRHD